MGWERAVYDGKLGAYTQKKTTSKFCLLFLFCCFWESENVRMACYIYQAYTHHSWAHRREKCCHAIAMERQNGVVVELHLCCCRNFFLLLLLGIFGVGGGKMKAKLIRKENISWNKKWKCTRQSDGGSISTLICVWGELWCINSLVFLASVDAKNRKRKYFGGEIFFVVFELFSFFMAHVVWSCVELCGAQ